MFSQDFVLIQSDRNNAFSEQWDSVHGDLKIILETKENTEREREREREREAIGTRMTQYCPVLSNAISDSNTD